MLELSCPRSYLDLSFNQLSGSVPPLPQSLLSGTIILCGNQDLYSYSFQIASCTSSTSLTPTATLSSSPSSSTSSSITPSPSQFYTVTATVSIPATASVTVQPRKARLSLVVVVSISIASVVGLLGMITCWLWWRRYHKRQKISKGSEYLKLIAADKSQIQYVSASESGRSDDTRLVFGCLQLKCVFYF
jgi:Mn2+/Fe2+ NRAMP family transporter